MNKSICGGCGFHACTCLHKYRGDSSAYSSAMAACGGCDRPPKPKPPMQPPCQEKKPCCSWEVVDPMMCVEFISNTPYKHPESGMMMQIRASIIDPVQIYLNSEQAQHLIDCGLARACIDCKTGCSMGPPAKGDRGPPGPATNPDIIFKMLCDTWEMMVECPPSLT